jgi:hypothetical protein
VRLFESITDFYGPSPRLAKTTATKPRRFARSPLAPFAVDLKPTLALEIKRASSAAVKVRRDWL